MTKIIIEEAAARDLGDIMAIERACMENPWSDNTIKEDFSRDFTHYLVAREGGRTIGFISAQLIIDSADINSVAVQKEYRRAGAGDALVSAMTERLFMLGAKEVLLEVRKSNAPAIGLYEKHGFFEISRRRGYYKNPPDDAIIMRADLEE